MECLKAERKILRQHISKSHTSYLAGSVLDRSRLESKYNRLVEVDKEIRKLLLENGEMSEEDWEAEMLVAEEYTDKFMDMCEEEECEVVSEKKKEVKQSVMDLNLPKLDFTPFDGHVANWISFWSHFKHIHENEGLSDSVKFQYLGQFMKGKAKEFLANYPPSGENYAKVIGDLKNRFAKDDMLLDFYVRNLLNLMISQLRAPNLKLSELYDNVKANLTNLEALNLPIKNYALFLVPLIESCLPVEILKNWDRFKTSLNKHKIEKSNESLSLCDDSLLVELMEFIKSEVDTETKVNFAKLSIEAYGTASTREPTAAALVSSAGSVKGESMGKLNYFCLFCALTNHNSQDCSKARKMSLEEKKEIIKNKKACFACLKKNHSYKNCKIYVSCLICKKKHYALMCPNLPSHVSGTNIKKCGAAEIGNDNETLMCCHNEVVLLQTLQVYLCANGIKRKVRVLLDSGSQLSYLSTQVARDLGLCSKSNRQ